jgi:acetyl esterase/lipase
MRRSLFVGQLAFLAFLPHVVLAADEFQLERNLEYARLGDISLKCDVRVPTGPGPFPAVLCVHGGAWMTGTKEHMNHVADHLAQKGYTTVSINYRLAPKHTFPAQIEDCRAALEWMRSHAGKWRLDATRIAGFGYSAGGHLVSLLATEVEANATDDKRLQCVVAGGAPCDFRLMPPNWETLAYWLGGTRKEKPEAYELASPLKFVSADDPPAFFFHGEQDLLVPRLSAEAMVFSLKNAGVSASMHLVPKAGHLRAFFDADAIGKSIEFLDSHLKADATKN